MGWEVVIKKDQFKIGDKVCYIQIDTIVPETEDFEFLRPRKFRIYTAKLRGQISQGLIVPLPDDLKNHKEDTDISSEMGVIKYEKPDNNPNYKKPIKPKLWYKKWIYLFKYNILFKLFPFLLKTKNPKFPSDLVSKTDEERIQNIPEY